MYRRPLFQYFFLSYNYTSRVLIVFHGAKQFNNYFMHYEVSEQTRTPLPMYIIQKVV